MLRAIEIWAQLWLCSEDCNRIMDLLSTEGLAKRKRIVKNMHLTVYHGRRSMPGLLTRVEPIELVIPTAETRFMVMAPGGENPRADLEPANRKVGIRIQRRNPARAAIDEFRDRIIFYETKTVLGSRAPSNHNRNAFGARYFQPHMAVLRAGSGIDGDLTKVGSVFRTQIGALRFDRFSVEISIRKVPESSESSLQSD